MFCLTSKIVPLPHRQRGRPRQNQGRLSSSAANRNFFHLITRKIIANICKIQSLMTFRQQCISRTWAAQSFLFSSSRPPCTMGNRFCLSGLVWAEIHLGNKTIDPSVKYTCRAKQSTEVRVSNSSNLTDSSGSPVQPPDSSVPCLLKTVHVFVLGVHHVIQLNKRMSLECDTNN